MDTPFEPDQTAETPLLRPDSSEVDDPQDQLWRVWADPPGVIGWLRSLQNDAIGTRIVATAFTFFLIGGITALLIRIQLATSENTFLSPQRYNEFFTMHGSTMMYLFAVPFLEGFSILLLPFLLGNREMPYPRLGVFSYFAFLFGGVLFYMSFLFDAVPDAGWFAYVPLSGPVFSPGKGMDFWLLALSVAEVAAIAAGIEIIIAILRMRAPGMSISRMPLFAWAMLVTAFSILFAFTPLIVASLFMELDRQFGTQFYNSMAGGSPLLWQHLFWIFGHPEVYIQFLPAVGMVSMIIPVFARRPIVGYPLIVFAMVATGFISFGLWVHHMFTTGLPQVAMTFFTAASTMIAVPSGIQIFAWITTIWQGRPVWKTPLLFSIGFIVVFVLGGITGVMVASIPFDSQVHDSFFVVAHFHYVLIGGVTFPIFAAMYYWLPKYTGKLFHEGLGKWNFWLVFIGFNITFFPQHIVGLLGMPRRVYTYPAGLGWEGYNLVSTIGAFILAAGVLLFLVNLVYMLRSGEPAGQNPWGADSLDWATPTPAPPYGFARLPIVHSRHPLWEQKALHAGSERNEKLAYALAEWPTTWRAALVSSTFAAEPEEVFRVSGPSIWPFFAAVGLIVIFASEIWAAHWATAIGALVLVVSIIGWHWPSPSPTTDEEEDAFAREHNINVRPNGSRAVAISGMYLTLLVIGIALAAFAFSYFYLRLQNPAWPPPGIPLPDLILPGAGLALAALSALPMRWARNGIHAGDTRRLRTGLAAGVVLIALSAAAVIFSQMQVSYGVSFHAYASLYHLTTLFWLALLLSGVLMSAVVLYWAMNGVYSIRRHVAVDVTWIFWMGMLAFSAFIYLMVYVTPYIL